MFRYQAKHMKHKYIHHNCFGINKTVLSQSTWLCQAPPWKSINDHDLFSAMKPLLSAGRNSTYCYLLT